MREPPETLQVWSIASTHQGRVLTTDAEDNPDQWGVKGARPRIATGSAGSSTARNRGAYRQRFAARARAAPAPGRRSRGLLPAPTPGNKRNRRGMARPIARRILHGAPRRRSVWPLAQPPNVARLGARATSASAGGSSMSIVAADSVSGSSSRWSRTRSRRGRSRRPTAPRATWSSLLADYAKPDERAEEAMERPLSFLLDEALHTAAPGERFDRLRALGDGVLYTCGFFGEHFEARGVDAGVRDGHRHDGVRRGRSMLRVPARRTTRTRPTCSTSTASCRRSSPRFVEVLTDVADPTIAQGATSSKSMLKLYERWLQDRERSPRAGAQRARARADARAREGASVTGAAEAPAGTSARCSKATAQGSCASARSRRRCSARSSASISSNASPTCTPS